MSLPIQMASLELRPLCGYRIVSVYMHLPEQRGLRSWEGNANALEHHGTAGAPRVLDASLQIHASAYARPHGKSLRLTRS